jgi:flavin-dependent dehydrogenase
MLRHPVQAEYCEVRRDYDVIIFGSGPAGAAAALALAHKGLTVAVVAKARRAGPPVGETVSPTIIRPLSRLGLWENFAAANHASAPGTVVIWGDERPYENDFILNPYGPGWHLDRARFDTMLIKGASAAGTDIYDGPAVDCMRATARAWIVRLSDKPFGSLTARWVIDATGRAAWLAQRQAVRRRQVDRLVALIKFETISSDSESRTLIESCALGWWYAAVLPERRAVAAYFTDSDLLPRRERRRDQLWNELLARTQLISKIMPVSTESRTFAAAACSGSLVQAAGEGWLAIGDAAQTYDPLSGQGIERALTSAIAAAEAISAAHAGDTDAFGRFAHAVDTQFQDYRHTHAKHYQRENRWPDQAFWQRRHENTNPRVENS